MFGIPKSGRTFLPEEELISFDKCITELVKKLEHKKWFTSEQYYMGI
jgi:hypothetical protein